MGTSLILEEKSMDEDKTMIKSVKDLTEEMGKKSAYITILTGKMAGQMFDLKNREYQLGRGTDADIQVNDDGISRIHAKIVRTELGTKIKDLESTNGIFYNGKKFTEKFLDNGDKIQIGISTVLKFSYKDELEEKMQKKLYDSAVKDGLTRIYNKRYFEDKFKAEFEYYKKTNGVFSLLAFDIDHFKKVNDTYGHAAGDYVLSTMAGVISATIRENDTFARTGGEEFSLIFKDVNELKGQKMADRVRKLVEGTNFIYNDTKIPISISIGIATLNYTSFDKPLDMVESADQFLYKAKQNGRNRVESIFS